MRIFLIGYMGCGKTTLGRELAAELKLTFIDLDSFLEEKYFKTIPQIFAEEGEESFRRKERKVLEEVSEFDDVVLATGGGAPCFFDNIDLMNRAGFCIFLDVDEDTLAERLIAAKTERPLIKGKSPGELKQFIGGMLEKRRPFYEKATFILRGNAISVAEITRLIENASRP
jgi:shikimate kinase